MKSIQRMVSESIKRYFDNQEYTTFGGQIITRSEIKAGKARWVKNKEGQKELREWKSSPKPKANRPVCGAKTRAGGQCKAKGCLRPDGKVARRCRMHGGLSTGPKGPMPCPTRTPDAAAKVIAGILQRHTVKQFCKNAGIAPGSYYLWMKRDPQFRETVRMAYRRVWG